MNTAFPGRVEHRKLFVGLRGELEPSQGGRIETALFKQGIQRAASRKDPVKPVTSKIRFTTTEAPVRNNRPPRSLRSPFKRMMQPSAIEGEGGSFEIQCDDGIVADRFKKRGNAGALHEIGSAHHDDVCAAEPLMPQRFALRAAAHISGAA